MAPPPSACFGRLGCLPVLTVQQCLARLPSRLHAHRLRAVRRGRLVAHQAPWALFLCAALACGFEATLGTLYPDGAPCGRTARRSPLSSACLGAIRPGPFSTGHRHRVSFGCRTARLEAARCPRASSRPLCARWRRSRSATWERRNAPRPDAVDGGEPVERRAA
jgi:hypothetical protein